MKKKEFTKGPLNFQSEEKKKIWEKSKALNQKINNCTPEEFDRKDEMLKEFLKEIGEGTVVLTPFYCDFGFNTKIGKNCLINVNCNFLDTDLIDIGDNTLIGPGVHIYAANHPISTKERIIPEDETLNNDEYNYIDSEGNFDEAINYTFNNFSEPVKIGKRCWIGGRTIILPGITIGDNTVVGAGSVVTKDLPSNVIAVGSPCKIIKKENKI